MRLGAHLSIAGGYTNALKNIVAIGGNCLQIFSTSPRNWVSGEIKSLEIANFIETKKRLDVNPVYFHASYLINLADGDRVGNLSKKSLIAELSIAEKLKVEGSIVHLGSFKNDKSEEKYQTLLNNISEVLKNAPADTLFIIENAGNQKIGKDLDEIAQIIKDLKDSRVKVCLDTCHLHAAGYNLSTSEELDKFLYDFDGKIGLPKLELIHANDSRDDFGSGRDRHENIGEGKVGISVFKLLMNHPKTEHLPFIIETPGFDQKGPDKKNLDILKGLVVE